MQTHAKSLPNLEIQPESIHVVHVEPIEVQPVVETDQDIIVEQNLFDVGTGLVAVVTNGTESITEGTITEETSSDLDIDI